MDFFQEQIKDHKRGAVFLPSVRKVRRKEMELSEQEFQWGAPDYKLYPSSIKSWNICPKEFIRSRKLYEGIKALDGIQRTRRGSAIHREFQEDFKLSDRICPLPLTNNMDERIANKLLANWPEIPFQDKEGTGFSGSVDSCMLWQNQIWPVEIKTTSIENRDEWKETILNKFPRTRTQWTIQLCIYIYHLRKLNYWTYPVNNGILVIVNACIDPADMEAEYEEVIRYADYEEKTSLLMEHLTNQRRSYIDLEDLPCTYPLCKLHEKEASTSF